MKKLIAVLFLFAFFFMNAQTNPAITKWLQNTTVMGSYFVSGNSTIEKNVSNFEGKLIITQYKNSKKGGKVFGKYELFEEPKGKHSGTFKGKFIYTFKFIKKTQKVESEYLEFVGDWASYDKTLNYKTDWKNQ